MKPRDTGAALLCVLLWGLNFVVIDEGLKHLPPLLFVSLRFLLTALPAVFFIPRPDVGWRTVIAVGMLTCVAQFGFLFVAIHNGLPAGLASVIIQCQALFTVGFAAPWLRERVTPRQLAGVSVAAGGLAVIALTRADSVPSTALALGVAAGASWGAANVITRAARPVRPFSLLVYGALVATLPLIGLSILIDGPNEDLVALRHLDLTALSAVGFVVILATLVGFGLWYRLLSLYDASRVAPFGLLVPVVGLAAAWLLAGEQPSMPEIGGSAITIAGLAVLTLTGRPTPSRGGNPDRGPHQADAPEGVGPVAPFEPTGSGKPTEVTA